MKFIVTVDIEVDIDDYFIDEGYEQNDMIGYEVAKAINGLEYEITDIQKQNKQNECFIRRCENANKE